MEVIAKLNNLRISPRKVRLVANLIKGMDVKDARAQLKFLVKKSSGPVAKLLESAVANAKNNFSLEENNLYVSRIFVDSGQVLKRWLPRAFGRATPLMKRTSHITIALSVRDETSPKKGGDERTPGAKKKIIEKERKGKPAQGGSSLGGEETVEELDKEDKKEITKKSAQGETSPFGGEIKRPKKADADSKKKVFSRQGVKKMFQRKSI